MIRSRTRVDYFNLFSQDYLMENTIPPEIKVMMQEAVRYATTGHADPEVLRKIHEEAERIRKKVRGEHGILDIGVPAIREVRDSQ